MQITKGRIKTALKVVVYGPEGIGKTTFASQLPSPVFIDTEGSTKHMDVTRTDPSPESWEGLKGQVKHFILHPEHLKTLVIDTMDWAEKLCITALCDKAKVDGIEGYGYGKGYTYLEEEVARFLHLLEDLVGKGVNICLTAHATMRKFEQPDEMGAYDRWEMKLQKKVAAIVKEWADMVLFANYKTYVINVDNQGAAKGKNKAQGGSRIMHTTHHPCWDAKNRFGLDDELPFEYSRIAHLFVDMTPSEEFVQHDPPKAEQLPPEAEQLPTKAEQPSPNPEPTPVTPSQVEQPKATAEDTAEAEELEKVPANLRELMIQNNVKPHEVRYAVATSGYFPNDVKIHEYPQDFIDGCLVAAWPQVLSKIILNRKEIPFW